MRKHILNSFDRFWIENMHGNRKISEYAPDGRTSETIFAIPGFSAGIQQGVAISLWVKNGKAPEGNRILFREDLNDARAADRRKKLVDGLTAPDWEKHYATAHPTPTNRFSFRPQKVSGDYLAWPSIDSLCQFDPTLGLLENRQESLIAIDKKALEVRLRAYLDPEAEWDEAKDSAVGFYKNFARFDARKTRDKILSSCVFHDRDIRRFLIRPMDLRWCYYTSVRPLWNEPRPDYVAQLWPGNATIMTRRKGVANPEGVPFFFTSYVGFQHALNTDAYYIPLHIRDARPLGKKQSHGQMGLLNKMHLEEEQANLSVASTFYLDSINAPKDTSTWMHCLAIGYSPAYLRENADGIRQDWPHIPLPDSRKSLGASAELGQKIAALLDTESPVKSVTTGDLRPELKLTAVATRIGGGSLKESDLSLAGSWGHAGKGGVTMPGKGKLLERDYSVAESDAIAVGARGIGLSEEEALSHLGSKTCDVYLNNSAYWSNIPIRVWEYTIGGYQVIKKWLSYREAPLLGRPLTKDEVRYVQEMARRIAAILLLEPALDANYQAVKAHTFPWPPKS